MERTLSLSPRSEVSFAANAGVLAGAGALFAAALAASAAEECQAESSVTACSSAQIGAGLPHIIRLWSDQQKMDKGQDQTYRGRSVCAETGEPFEYVMVTDGHGGDDCIRALRSIPQSLLIEMLGTKNPVEALAAHVNPRSCKHFGGGATVCLAKIFSDRVETINCGDSQVAVYKDGALLFLSQEHNHENQAERARLKSFNPRIRFEPSSSIKVISPTQMRGCYSEYATWPCGSRLACTQALGGGGKTGYAPDHVTIPLEPGSTYKVVIGSDGVWDVVNKDDPADLQRFATMDGPAIMSFVRGRWLQPWDMATMKSPTVFTKGQFSPQQCDDYSVAMADITPL